MSFTIALLKRFFSHYQQIEKYYIAYSGGLDSTVLLHAMHIAGLPIHAVHVNHHLQEQSNQWQQHCESICKKWGVPLTVLHAQVSKSPQKSLEDASRKARYALLDALLTQSSALVTAHHQNDLSETMLLQLLRGAGPAGLAAMPACKSLSKGMHLRPLLEFSRAELSEYAYVQNLQWIEDPSNETCDFDRNYLRKVVMPKIEERWPAASQTLTRSARLQAEAMHCLQELAKIDIQPCSTDQASVIKVSVLKSISQERLKNLLRFWINSQNIRVPSRKILQHIVTDIVLKEKIETSPVQIWKEGEIRRYQNKLYLMRPLTTHDPSQVFRWKIDQPLHIESINRTLTFNELKDSGVKLPSGVNELIVRFREGGERLKPIGQKQHRSLKKLLNEAAVPPWERSRIPLIYYQDQLIAVLGYWHAEPECETPV